MTNKYIIREWIVPEVNTFLKEYAGADSDYTITWLEHGEYGAPDYYELEVTDPILESMFCLHYNP